MKTENSSGRINIATNESMGRDLQQYFAVAVGKIPGLYTNWDDAREQLFGVSCCKYEKFSSRAPAVAFLQANGIQQENIRVFKRAFTENALFKPDSSRSFKKEFEDFASSQNWCQAEKRSARIDAIRDELIYYYLPEGLAIDQYDEDSANIRLRDDQKHKIYNAMCKQSGKATHSSTTECMVELKKPPYVNIFDFVDTFRTGEEVRSFDDWETFVLYTKGGRAIDLQYAKESEFLQPLLQKIGREGHSKSRAHLRGKEKTINRLVLERNSVIDKDGVGSSGSRPANTNRRIPVKSAMVPRWDPYARNPDPHNNASKRAEHLDSVPNSTGLKYEDEPSPEGCGIVDNTGQPAIKSQQILSSSHIGRYESNSSPPPSPIVITSSPLRADDPVSDTAMRVSDPPRYKPRPGGVASGPPHEALEDAFPISQHDMNALISIIQDDEEISTHLQGESGPATYHLLQGMDVDLFEDDDVVQTQLSQM